MQIMVNKKNVKLTKVEKTREAKRVAAKAQAIIAMVQHPRSFIPTFRDDVFVTHLWSQMSDQVDNGSKGSWRNFEISALYLKHGVN
jgi:hypothetical protein